ncbi:hypothetical protein H6F77_01555 [Microcoleus sp. FACHB-831]|uniref:glycerophosphoryl diester phosphodiesterase membrane domain-containing protein n=1 Tax=Microcoleus sp. FACHB-831 TaxID=2692827 RepID=UPI00168524E3|nr:hypothetical protein [Microcoleus sp. FACHB-831]MBD1919805.1 hypothetical protein [Microcoleus sp. FACHB-831]
MITIVAAIIFAVLGWITLRLFIGDLPLAIEKNITLREAVSRSWQLTKGYLGHIQAIQALYILVLVPLLMLTTTISIVLFYPLVRILPVSLYFFIPWVAGISTGFLIGVIAIPPWQAIKAVFYYEVRNYKEGLGLELRDRER